MCMLARTKMQFSIHLLPLIQLLFSTATVTAATSSIESSGQGSIEMVLYPYTTDGVEIQTDNPTTPTDEPKSPAPPSDFTTRDDVQLQTTTERHEATTDHVPSVTEAVPSTNATSSSTEESSSLPTNTEYETTTQPDHEVSDTTTKGSPTLGEYQTATPDTTLSTVTEPEHASTADSPETFISQSTSELTPMSPTTFESTEESPTMDQKSIEDSTITVSPAVNDVTESSNIITSPATEPPVFPTTGDSTPEFDAASQSSAVITEFKSSTLVTPTLKKPQFGNTMIILPTPSQSAESSPTADIFSKDSTATDVSAFMQSLGALFIENPSTANKYLATTEHTTIMEHSTATMASNNDQSTSPITNAVYSISNTVTRANLSPAIDVYSTAMLQSSKGSATLAVSSQSIRTTKSPSIPDHQTIAMDLKFSTTSNSHIMSPTTAKYMHTSTSAGLVSLSAVDSKSTSVLKPQSVTQLRIMTTTEFPSSIDFPTTSPHKSSLSNTDFTSDTVAIYSLSSLMIQPTSVAFAKTIVSSISLSTMNSARVMSSVNFESKPSMSMSLHAHFVVESSSVTLVQSPVMHNLSTTSQPLSFMLTSEVLTSSVPQATVDLSLATTTLESALSDFMTFSTMTTSSSNLTSPVPQVITTPESPIPTVSIDSMPPQATTIPESQFPTTYVSSSTVLASKVLTSPVPQATANPSLVVTTTLKSQIPTILTPHGLTPPKPQTTASPSLATTTLEPSTSRNSPLATEFLETSRYETIANSASTMELIVPVESTTIPRISFKSLQHHSVTESPIATPSKISNTEFLVVAMPSKTMLTNYHSTTTNYYSRLEGSSESRITREFPYETQQVSSTATKFHSLNLQLSTTVDPLHVSLLSTATKYLPTSPPYSSPSSLPGRQNTSSQFPSTSPNPPFQYTQSPVPGSPTITESESAIIHLASTENLTTGVKSALFTSPHATVSVFPASTETEPRSQSELLKMTVNLSQSHSQTNIQFLTPIISPTPASIMMSSDPTTQSNVRPTLTTASSVDTNISATNARELSSRSIMTVGSIFTNESLRSTPVTEPSNTIFLTTSDQIPITTPSTDVFMATEITAINSPTSYTFPFSLTSIPVAESISPSEFPPSPGMELLVSTESHPILSRTIKISSTAVSMVDAINSTMTDISSMRSMSESEIFTQPMPSTNDPLRSFATSQLLETTTVTESQFVKSSVVLKNLTITDAPSAIATANGATLTMTVESPIVTPSQTGTTKSIATTSIDLVTNNVPQPTQGHSISIEPITINHSPSRESPSITDTHTATTEVVKLSSIIRSNQSSERDTVTLSVPIMPTKPEQPMLSITPTAVTPSDSITEPSTNPTPLKSMTVPEFDTITNSLAITESLKIRATESHPIPSQTIKIPSAADSMIDAINSTMTDISSMRSMSESEIFIQPMPSTNDPLRSFATSQLLETTTVTESPFVKSSIALKNSTITDVPSAIATTNGSTLTMTVESPIVTPSQTGTTKSTTSIDLVMNNVSQSTQGHSMSIESITTNYSPLRESSSVMDTHIATTEVIKLSSIIRNNQSSERDTVTLSVPIMPSITAKPEQPMLSITPTAVTPSDSITEPSTTPTPLKSKTVPEFDTTTNSLAITESLKIRATESHPIPSRTITTSSIAAHSMVDAINSTMAGISSMGSSVIFIQSMPSTNDPLRSFATSQLLETTTVTESQFVRSSIALKNSTITDAPSAIATANGATLTMIVGSPIVTPSQTGIAKSATSIHSNSVMNNVRQSTQGHSISIEPITTNYSPSRESPVITDTHTAATEVIKLSSIIRSNQSSEQDTVTLSVPVMPSMTAKPEQPMLSITPTAVIPSDSITEPSTTPTPLKSMTVPEFDTTTNSLVITESLKNRATESHPIPSQTIKIPSTADSMIDAINSTMTDISSMESMSESEIFIQPMPSTNDPLRSLATTQLLEITTVTESPFVKSSITLKNSTITDAPSAIATANGSTLTMTIESPIVTPSQTGAATSIDLVTNDISQPTQGHSISMEPIITYYSPSRESPVITDTHTAATEVIKLSSIIRSDQSSERDTVTLSVPVTPSMTAKPEQPMLSITPTAVTPSDSITEPSTTPTPLKSMTVPEFDTTTNSLAITESLKIRATESHPIPSQTINDIPQSTQGHSISIEPITTNYLSSRESPSVTDTHTTTTEVVKLSSIIRSNQSSERDTVTLSVPIMPSITAKLEQPMMSITPTAVIPSDSITEPSTTPTPSKSMTVPEFDATTNSLAITESLNIRATESHSATPQMTKVSTTSGGYQSLTSTFTVSPPSASAIIISPVPSKITSPSVNVSLSENLVATTKLMNPVEIFTTSSHFATAANFTETQITIVQSSGLEAIIMTKAISTTELAPSQTFSKEFSSILDSVPPATTSTTLGVQTTTNENSRLSYTANSTIYSLATSTANPSMATYSPRLSSSPSESVTLESSDTQGSSVPLVLSTIEYSSMSLTTKTTGISLNSSITENPINSLPQTISSMITISATTDEPNSVTGIFKSTPVATEFSTTTRYGTVAESLTVSDSSVDMKSLEILPTSMVHSSSRSMFTAVSPSMTAPPSVTRKIIISMEPTPSAINMQPSLVSSINLATTKSMTEETFSSMTTANETQFPQSSAVEASIITESSSTAESHAVTPSVSLDLPPTRVITSSLMSIANPSASDGIFLSIASSTALVIQATASENSIILATPTVTETERTVEASHVTVSTQLLLPSVTEPPASSEPVLTKSTTFTEIFTSSAMESEISASSRTITTTESFTISKPMSIGTSSLSSPLIITVSPNPDTATESQETMVFTTTRGIQVPTSRFYTSSNVVETATTTEPQVIEMEATMITNTAVIINSPSLSSILPSVTLQASINVEPSMVPPLSTSEYSSTSPSTLITRAATVPLSLPTTEQSISVTSSVSASVIVPSATTSKHLSEMGLLMNTSLVITRSPTVQSTTIDSSFESLELTMKRSTTESLNATESVVIMNRSLDVTMLPVTTETLPPISTEQLTPVISMITTRLEGESLTKSGSLVASTTVLSSLLPSLLITEYPSTYTVTISSAAAISSSPAKTEYSITTSATLSLEIVPAVTVSESLSEMGMTTEPSSHNIISASPTIATMTVHESTKSAAKQTTIEPSNTTESTLIAPTMLPESTKMLLPTTSEQLMSLTIVTTTDSIRFEVDSSTISGLLVTYTAFLNDTPTATVGPNVRLSESSSLLFSRYSESRAVASPLTESQTATFKLLTAHQSTAVLSQSRESVLITQSPVSPSVTLKSSTDSSFFSTLSEDTEYPISLTSMFPIKATKLSTMSESAVSELSVTALRSVIDSESTAILTQTVATTAHPSRFTTVASFSIRKPLPTVTKSVSNSPQHSTAATSVTIAESLRTASSTTLFPDTLGLLTATESVIRIQQTRTIAKSQIISSESPVSLESMSNSIAVTKTLSTVQSKSEGEATTSSLLIGSKTLAVTVTKSLLTIGHSSIKEYSSEPLVSMEVTSYPITATNPLTFTPSGSVEPRVSTEAPVSTLKPTSISESLRSSTVIRITNSIKPTPQHTSIPNLTTLSTSKSSLSVSSSPTPGVEKSCKRVKKTSNELGITFVWPETLVNTSVNFTCPKNSAIKLPRKCTTGGHWGGFDEKGCGVLANNFTNLVIGSKNLTNNTLEMTADTLSKLVVESLNNRTEQSMDNMNEISNTLINIANYVNTSNAMINETVVGNIVKTLDSLLQWDPSTILTNSSSRIVESFERVTSQYAQNIEINSMINFTNPTVSIMAENMPAEILQQKGRNLAFHNHGQIIETSITPGQLSSQQQAAISLPASLFNRISMPSVGMFFGLYENATLFPVGGENSDISAPRQPQVCSNILSATVGQNMDLRNLNEDPVKLTFRLEDKLPGVYVAPNSERCVSWDFVTQDWTEQGCSVINTNEDGVFVCHCNHLTNFAILVDMCETEEDCLTSTTMAPTTQPTKMQLERLNNTFTNLTNDTYGEAVMMLANIIGGTENSTANQNAQVLTQVAQYFDSLATFVNDSNVTINETVVNDVIQVVSSLSQWEPESVMAKTSSSVVESFEKVIALYAQQLPLNGSVNFTLPSLTLLAESRSIESLIQEGRSFTIGNNKATAGQEGDVMQGELHPTQDAAVNLPASLFQRIENRTMIGIFFALYNAPTLFPINSERSVHSDEADVGSPVLSITVGPGLNFVKLEHNITIILRIIPNNLTVPDSERCVSWDFSRQDWTTDGCTTHIGEDGIVSCSCNHLTNFAIIVDICPRLGDCKPSKVDKALTYISYIGMSISIVFLVITIITLFLFKEVRQKDISKYHIQLCLAILLMLVVAFVLIASSVGDMTTLYEGCMIVSVLVHYFTLVAVMWMGAEALLMFQKLVYVFYKITTKFIITVSIICWTVPSILVAIPLAVDLATGYNIESDIIIKRANYTEDISYCFLSHIGAFWGAFLGPIFIIMLFNIFIFIRVIIVMVRHTRDTAARLNKPVSKKTIGRLMISIGGVMFLFGLTWLFAILTFSVDGLREIAQILFTVFNSFQGFFIFIFVCVVNKEVVESWREVLSCGRYQSKLLHPTPAKVVAVRKYQTNTNSTGFSSSASGGGKYNSESLKSGYESTTLSVQNVQQQQPQPARVSTQNKLPTDLKTATSDRAIAPSTINATTINWDIDGGETTVHARKKSVVKIEVAEEIDIEVNREEKSRENTTEKHTVTIEVVEEA